MKNYILNCFLAASMVLLVTSCSEEPIEDNVFGTLTGKVVTKGDNTPLANVKISSSPVSTTVFSDEQGNFVIENIQIGEYSFQAELTEFQTAFEAANIIEGKSVAIVFELDSINASNLAPLSPQLLFPKDGDENIGTQAQFLWSSSKNDADVINYSIELRNGATNEITTYNEIKDTTFLVENLAVGSNYFWQVSADDGVNTPVQSELGGFVTNNTNDNRYLYVREIGGNNVIFSGGESLGDDDEDLDQNEVQLTSSNLNSYRPIKNTTINKIAFLRTIGAETHIFTMNSDGTGLNQVTSTVPVAGFRNDELEFTWYADGAKLYYSNFNKLYSINVDGSGLEEVYQTGSAFISEIAVNPTNELVVLKTNDINGYNAKIAVINVITDAEVEVVISGVSGALGGVDFSADATRVLYTRDMSAAENTGYRQLDSRIFEYDLAANTATEIDTDKASGTNDLDAKYAPDEGSIIFVNTSNDGVSEKRIYKTEENNGLDNKKPLFTSAFMPNWE
ncbi:carboxypeptidase regulatory-like domain-containing protein [Aurantibacter crassamenti]|uniref:carboxypeptidase regulatory-like domain-containing protein n=1 Tax=Aurantibacter crassamenti TaxID=1837375 RepID=UPI0019397A2E|nr:carboxypeptidase regulatory-like domain-containing protein [Aurantibacter crassamenti]MBM1106302.1 carboxypeptidase regulatory-like domain-containing protein [Aurantibacter crassamenti]